MERRRNDGKATTNPKLWSASTKSARFSGKQGCEQIWPSSSLKLKQRLHNCFLNTFFSHDHHQHQLVPSPLPFLAPPLVYVPTVALYLLHAVRPVVASAPCLVCRGRKSNGPNQGGYIIRTGVNTAVFFRLRRSGSSTAKEVG